MSRSPYPLYLTLDLNLNSLFSLAHRNTLNLTSGRLEFSQLPARHWKTGELSRIISLPFSSSLSTSKTVPFETILFSAGFTIAYSTLDYTKPIILSQRLFDKPLFIEVRSPSMMKQDRRELPP